MSHPKVQVLNGDFRGSWSNLILCGAEDAVLLMPRVTLERAIHA